VQAEVDWPALLAYISTKAPAMAASFRGVSRRDIEAREAQYSIILPASYVGFLLAMGEDSAQLRPLGPTQSHRFSKLPVPRPGLGYPSKRFFKVSFETDPLALAALDQFLDLARGDARDALLVEFEVGGDEEPPVGGDEFTFGETITTNIFVTLDLARRKFIAAVYVPDENPTDGLGLKESAIALLADLGFMAVLPELARVACLSRQGVSALVDVDDETELVEIRLGSDDLGALESVIDRLLEVLPAANLAQEPREQTQRFEV